MGMYGVNMDAFLCLGNVIKWPETTSKAISYKTMNKIAAIDRTLLTRYEQLHLDMFLFSYYAGGMANVDVCNLTWDCVQEDRIVYERIKFPKTAKPILLQKARDIMNKYKEKSFENYVFPVFSPKYTNLFASLVYQSHGCSRLCTTFFVYANIVLSGTMGKR